MQERYARNTETVESIKSMRKEGSLIPDEPVCDKTESTVNVPFEKSGILFIDEALDKKE